MLRNTLEFPPGSCFWIFCFMEWNCYFSPFSLPKASKAQGQHFTEAQERKIFSLCCRWEKDHNHTSSPSLTAKGTTHSYHCQDIRYCLVKLYHWGNYSEKQLLHASLLKMRRQTWPQYCMKRMWQFLLLPQATHSTLLLKLKDEKTYLSIFEKTDFQKRRDHCEKMTPCLVSSVDAYWQKMGMPNEHTNLWGPM